MRPFNTGDCLIEMTALAGLIVIKFYLAQSSEILTQNFAQNKSFELVQEILCQPIFKQSLSKKWSFYGSFISRRISMGFYCIEFL